MIHALLSLVFEPLHLHHFSVARTAAAELVMGAYIDNLTILNDIRDSLATLISRGRKRVFRHGLIKFPSGKALKTTAV